MRFTSKALFGLFAAFAALPLGACNMLPASGPTASQVEQNRSETAEFTVLDVNSDVIQALTSVPEQTLSGSFRGGRPAANLRIGPGDILQISIWEAGGSGLFAPVGTGISQSQQGARPAQLQPLSVEPDGSIAVPFVGRMKVIGLSADQVRQRIESALRDKAIQPQALVTISNNNANVATVGGEVGKAGVVPLNPRGDKLLDVISQAGGARFPAYETFVRLTRKGHGVTVLLQRVVNSASENVFIQPGDDIYVSRRPRTFSAFGAAGKVGNYPFETEQLSLAEAIAKSGGLLDNQADPSGVFLFRHERGSVVNRIRPDLNAPASANVPVVYRLNLREADGYFRAQAFTIRDKDVILVANADGTQLLKFFTLLRGATGMVADFRATAVAR